MSIYANEFEQVFCIILIQNHYSKTFNCEMTFNNFDMEINIFY